MWDRLVQKHQFYELLLPAAESFYDYCYHYYLMFLSPVMIPGDQVMTSGQKHDHTLPQDKCVRVFVLFSDISSHFS